MDMLADEIELLLFLERAFDDLQLPGAMGMARLYYGEQQICLIILTAPEY